MAIGLMIILLAIAAAQYAAYSLPSANDQAATSTSSNSETAASWKTYQDDQYHFSLQYPADFTITEEPGQSVTLVAPIKSYFKTVLANEASVTISDPATTCPASQGENLGATTTVNSSGGAFAKVPWSGVGAGNLYEGADYTLLKNGNCYSLHVLVHSANGGGLYYSDPQQIKQTDDQQAKDKAAFLALADKIVSTFKFTK